MFLGKVPEVGERIIQKDCRKKITGTHIGTGTVPSATVGNIVIHRASVRALFSNKGSFAP